MFHDNASVEKGFSINKECLIENLLNKSLIGQRHVQTDAKAAGENFDIEINKTMTHCARNSRSYYMEALIDKKKLDK